MSPFFSHRHFRKTFYFVTFLGIGGRGESNLHAVGNLALSPSEIALFSQNLFPQIAAGITETRGRRDVLRP